MSQFKSQFSSYQSIITEDNSPTLYSEAFGENCHSTAGAYAETRYNFVEGCRLLEKVKSIGHFNILEVGFGLGIGLKASLEALVEADLPLKGLFVSTEIDPELIEWAREHTLIENCPFQYTDLTLQKKGELSYYHANLDKLEIIVLLGDARKSLPLAKDLLNLPPFECIYQDAFSPKKNPALWTYQWFELLGQLSGQSAILSTYSAASSVRKTLAHVGWRVHNRAGFGQKRSSTWAGKTGTTDSQILSNIKSPAIPLLDDQDLLPPGHKLQN